MLDPERLRPFRRWQYRDPGANCSDYVAAFLLAFTPLVASDFPVGVVAAHDGLRKARAHERVVKLFRACEPRDFALACQYVGRVFVHVGVVYGGNVWHSGAAIGTVVESVEKFECRGQHGGTRYWIHNKLT